MKLALQLASLVLVSLAAYAQMPLDPGLPAFHKKPPSSAQPPILHGAQLTGKYFSHPYQVTVYEMAYQIPNVLYQLPCYCRCDLALGHKSLRSCYQDTHATTCSTCMGEAAYAYQQTKLGKTPAQIRAGIERGEYLDVDLEQVKM